MLSGLTASIDKSNGAAKVIAANNRQTTKQRSKIAQLNKHLYGEQAKPRLHQQFDAKRELSGPRDVMNETEAMLLLLLIVIILGTVIVTAFMEAFSTVFGS